MERKLVKDFKEGEHINTNLLISSLVKGVTNSGAPYLSLSYKIIVRLLMRRCGM